MNAAIVLAYAIVAAAMCVSRSARADAEFVLINIDDPGEGLNDPTSVEPIGGNPGTTLGEQRLIAVRRALDIWGAALDSDVPTEVGVQFNHLGCYGSGGLTVFAGARARAFISGEIVPGADPDLWYAYALANRIAGHDLDDGSAEVFIEFHSGFDGDDSCGFLPWYYGLDEAGRGPMLLRTALHELAHALGVAMAVDSDTGAWWGDGPDSFSALVLDRTQGKHLGEMTAEERVAAFTHVRQLVWDGPAVRKAAEPLLTRGTPMLAVDPSIEGFSGLVSDANFGARALDRSVTAELVVLPQDSCVVRDEVAERVVLVDAPCRADELAEAVEGWGGVGLLYTFENPAWSTPPEPLDHSMPVASGIPILTVARPDAALLTAAAEEQSLTVTISANPDQLLGADPEGRLYLHATDSDVQSHSTLPHWDLLSRPNLLMEGKYGSGDDQRDLDVTLALLVDIGWAICGDGRVTAPEECDDGDGNSNTARSACRSDCRAPACGDGVIDIGEACDDGLQNGEGAQDACRSNCQPNLCGNGVLDGDEECDDGERNDDGVPNACRTGCTDPRCGDGVVDEQEDCDDGAGNSDAVADRCRSDCTEPRCGDAVVDADETCDEGPENGSRRSTCRADCQPEAEDDDGGTCDGGSCESETAAAGNGAGGCGCRVGSQPDSPRSRYWAVALLACVAAWRWPRRCHR